jgi:hypothetical protein
MVRGFICAALLIAMSATVADAQGYQSPFLVALCSQMLVFANWIRFLGYTAFMISMALISIPASVTGKFAGGQFISVVGGLFVLSFIPAILAYLTSGTGSLTCPALPS